MRLDLLLPSWSGSETTARVEINPINGPHPKYIMKAKR